MVSFLPEFLTVASVHLLAVMSPGPDFILISRNAMMYSRKVGIYSAMGMGLGIFIHITYSLIGIGFIISKSLLLFSILKFIGAGYLFYIGFQCLRAKPAKDRPLEEREKKNMTAWAAVRMGFLANILNPKATLFFLALFTQVINPSTPKEVQIFYGIEMSFMTFAWFAFVAITLSHHLVRNRFTSIQHYIERTFGFILVSLALKIALSSR